MRSFLSWNRMLIVAVLLASCGGLVFQNCAKVSFSEKEGASLVDNFESENHTAEPSTRGPANGDGYEGKVSYYHRWTQPGECNSDVSIIESEIEKEESTYRKTMAECQDIAAVELDAELITIVDEGLIYDGTDYFTSYPESCAAIYENGGNNPNGLYWVDADQDGPGAPELKYCNMVLIAMGWSAWGDWTACDVSCGTGMQQRERTCVAGGCSGASTQSRDCQKPACP